MTVYLSFWHGLVDVPTSRLSSQEIIADVASRNGMSVARMLSKNKERHYAYARFEAMHLLKVTPTLNGRMRSLPEIGRELGGLDHTTVINGLNRWPKIQATREAAE